MSSQASGYGTSEYSELTFVYLALAVLIVILSVVFNVFFIYVPAKRLELKVEATATRLEQAARIVETIAADVKKIVGEAETDIPLITRVASGVEQTVMRFDEIEQKFCNSGFTEFC